MVEVEELHPEFGARVRGFDLSSPLEPEEVGLTRCTKDDLAGGTPADNAEIIRDMHFMLQLEVVKRMAAQPGGKDFGRLAILCQYHCQVVPLFNVPPESFNPVPRVESGFVRLIPHDEPPVKVADYALFESVVAKAFSQRRKTLRNSLRKLLSAEQIEEAGIDPGLRPEALGLDDYARLTAVVAHYGGKETG